MNLPRKVSIAYIVILQYLQVIEGKRNAITDKLAEK